MAKLIFTDKSHVGQVYELTVEKTTVGRADGNTLVIPDRSLSAVHCEILVHGPEVIVHDLGSRNGTYVNGAKLINQQSQLKSGQIVRFGSVEARLELDEPPADDTQSEMTAIHTMGRILREQRREREHPKPADPSMKLPSSEASADADQTVTTVVQPPVKAEAPSPAPLSPAPSEPGSSSAKAVIVIVAALVLGLILLVWWWSTK